jgi:isoquinoline 1-oxidoreductase subunit beta
MKVSRRAVVGAGAAAGGGLLVWWKFGGAKRLPQAKLPVGAHTFAPNAFVRITPDDVITLVVARVEMGQGVVTSTAQLLAEELEVDPARITIELAPADRAYDNSKLGFQLTGGSSSTVASFEPMRMAGAQAREMLKAAAARQWGVERSAIVASDGLLIHRPSNRSARYGEMVDAAASMQVGPVPLKQGNYKVIGTPTRRIDASIKTNGAAVFGIDVKVPGAVVAVLVRPPVFGAQLVSFEATEAKKQAGVLDVVGTPVGVAVIAQSYWFARRAAALVQAKFNDVPFSTFDSASLLDAHRTLAQDSPKKIRGDGDWKTPPAGVSLITAEYTAPYLAHAPLEPQNATASVTGDRCEIWAPTQSPAMAKEQVALALDISQDNVTVHQTWLGGSFGRRINQDYAVEAALVSKVVGKPVQVVWSREDDMRSSIYRPAASHFLSGGVDASGNAVFWKHTVATQSLIAQIGDGFIGGQFAELPPFLRRGIATAGKAALTPSDETSVEGANSLPYEIPNLSVFFARYENGAPIGSWRSVGHSHTAFATESFIDELASAAKKDPFEFRRNLLKKDDRRRALLELVASKANWGSPLPEGRGRGIAVHQSFDTYAAAVIEVGVDGKNIRAHRVVIAVDCGLVVNPNLVEAQLEGSVVFALTAALKGQIEFVKGQVQQSNFHDYELLRMHQSPSIEVHLQRSDAPPTGVGEPGVPVIAPALANAVFAVSGQRLRHLPLRLS